MKVKDIKSIAVLCFLVSIVIIYYIDSYSWYSPFAYEYIQDYVSLYLGLVFFSFAVRWSATCHRD